MEGMAFTLPNPPPLLAWAGLLLAFVGLASLGQDTVTWLHWLGTINPVLAGILIGAGFTVFGLYLLEKAKGRTSSPLFRDIAQVNATIIRGLCSLKVFREIVAIAYAITLFKVGITALTTLVLFLIGDPSALGIIILMGALLTIMWSVIAVWRVFLAVLQWFGRDGE